MWFVFGKLQPKLKRKLVSYNFGLYHGLRLSNSEPNTILTSGCKYNAMQSIFSFLIQPSILQRNEKGKKLA